MTTPTLAPLQLFGKLRAAISKLQTQVTETPDLPNSIKTATAEVTSSLETVGNVVTDAFRERSALKTDLHTAQEGIKTAVKSLTELAAEQPDSVSQIIGNNPTADGYNAGVQAGKSILREPLILILDKLKKLVPIEAS